MILSNFYMNKERFLFGSFLYAALIVSGALSTVTIISLLALPAFIGGVILCIILAASLPGDKKIFTNILLVIGILLLAFTIGYTADQTAQFIRKIPIVYIYGKDVLNTGAVSLPIIEILEGLFLGMASSLLITFGIKKRINPPTKPLLLTWILLLLSSPLTIATVATLAMLGLPFGA